MTWLRLNQVDLEALSETKDQFHQATQSVAAVGRHFLEDSVEDENAVLTWNVKTNRLVGKWIPIEEGQVRAGISFDKALVSLEKENSGIIDSMEIHAKTFPQLMLWFEEQTGKLGLPTENFSANLPYEIPIYPTQKNQAFDLSAEDLNVAFSALYQNSFHLLTRLKESFEGSSEVTLWPHHFDQAISIKLKDSGNPETSSYLGIGLSPGDEGYSEPYFYVNSWPYIEEETLDDIPFGKWHTENWIGAVLTLSELWETQEQESAVNEFGLFVSNKFKELLLQ